MLSGRRRRPVLRLVFAFLLLVLPHSAALAEKRVALVLGNGAYANVPKLSNPPRDAAAIASLLREAGFEVVDVRSDLGSLALRRAIRDFADRVRDADTAVVFYAGHGIEVNGTNYLIPIDAVLERDLDVEDEAVPLDRISQILEPAKRLRLIILDACRDNPFARSMKRSVGSRSIGRGLAKVEVLSSDTLVAFAAKHGATAADGDGANSPYTTALIRHLTTPGLDLRLALGKVRDEVLKSTDNKQEPFVYGSLGGAEIALRPAIPSQPQARSEPQTTALSPFLLLTQSSWNNDCVAYAVPHVTASNGPKHGKITFGEGPSTIRHIIGDDKKCLGRDVNSRLIYYAPSDPPAEVDQVSLDVVTAHGQRWGYDCTIRVSTRRANCQLRK
jgi:hypothetical protein